MDFGLSPDQIDLHDAKSTEFPWEAYRRVARLGVLGLLPDLSMPFGRDFVPYGRRPAAGRAG